MPTPDVFRPDAIARGLGRATTQGQPPFQVMVDWENDGTFSHANDDISALVRGTPSIQAKRGMNQVRPLGTVAAGSLSLDADNQDQRFSPENGSSVLAGELTAGRSIAVRALNGTAVVDVWRGVLDDIQPHPELLKQSVSLPCLGNLSKMRVTGNNTQPPPVYTALYQSITTDVAIGHVLDALGFPAAKRVLATGDVTLDWWWVSNQDAMTALQELVNTEGPGARLYEDASGNIVFENHNYRWTTARSMTSQVTFSDGSAGNTTEPLHSEPFAYDPGQKDIVNQCTTTVTMRSAKATAVVWTSTESVVIGPGATAKRRTSTSDPVTAAVTPVAGTDFTVSVGSVTSVALDRTSGADIEIAYTAGINGATITSQALRAQPVSTDSTFSVETTLDVSASTAIYDTRIYPLQLRSEVAANVLQDLVNAIPLWWQQPRPKVSITLIGNPSAQDARYVQGVTRAVSDRVTVQASKASLDADCWVEAVGQEIALTGRQLKTTLGLEKVAPEFHPAVWDSSTWDSAAVWWF